MEEETWIREHHGRQGKHSGNQCMRGEISKASWKKRGE
jgi:hypothetical protein